MSDFNELFTTLRESLTAAQWSQAVTLSRNAEFLLEGQSDSSLRVKVLERERALGIVVRLEWEYLDWQSDCVCDQDPCVHVAASAIAFKNGINVAAVESEAERQSLRYALRVEDGRLQLLRYLQQGEKQEPLRRRLMDYSGGVQSGRIEGAALHPSKEDFQVERLIDRDGYFEASQSADLFAALRELPAVYFEDAPARFGAPEKLRLVLERVSGGFRVRMKESEERRPRLLMPGVLFEAGELRALDAVPQGYEAVLNAAGLFIPETELESLLCRVLPELRRHADLEIEAEVPELIDEAPRIVFFLEEDQGALKVLPRLLYGEPPALELSSDGMRILDARRFVRRELSEEKQLLRRLQGELQLQVGRVVYKEGADAVRFQESLDRWEARGDGVRAFSREGQLEPRLTLDEQGLHTDFRLVMAGGTTKRADSAAVFAAWERGEQLVPLLEGGWAELPTDWLARYGERIRELNSLRDAQGRLSKRHTPMLAQFAEEVGANVEDSLRSFMSALASLESAPTLPADLQAALRNYQAQGVHWLQLLQGCEAGALLADDMGLGKTLQVIAVLEHRSLVVCPSSVIDSWCEQFEQFRPNFRVCRYHGAQRVFDAEADVVVTSYTLLRLEAERFSERWSCVVLDEAQYIKNPESATAQAAFALLADFRIALSGTPIENRLLDLWSQMHFLLPELLGSRTSFERAFASPIRSGSAEAFQQLRRRIKPFLLRRTKNDVAKELPPRTEVVLKCELSEEERTLYDSLYLSSREKVQRLLEENASMLSILEVLLRLRQLCAHPALLPDVEAATSSKTELLLESLQASKDAGHRALVFSQWTSMLDLMEEPLTRAGLRFLRLDGSTKDRAAVVRRFQNDEEFDLLLLSLKAGGVGLTLTAADHVYLFDSWWNPAVEAQAADRAHRIGQTRAVLIHRLIASNTVEENIRRLQQRKQELAENMLAAEAGGGEGISRDELLSLFEDLQPR